MLECSFQLPVVAKYPSKLLMRDPATNGETHRLRICVFLELGVRGRSMAFHAPYAQQKTHHFILWNKRQDLIVAIVFICRRPGGTAQIIRDQNVLESRIGMGIEQTMTTFSTSVLTVWHQGQASAVLVASSCLLILHSPLFADFALSLVCWFYTFPSLLQYLWIPTISVPTESTSLHSVYERYQCLFYPGFVPTVNLL